jgi:hypothetical protein
VPTWSVTELADVPTVRSGDDEPTWHALQHYFGITAFGVNVFVARAPDQTLVDEHDETESGQEELYLVLDGEVTFGLDGETVSGRRGTVVAVTGPDVRRRAAAVTAGASLLVVGVRPGCFESTWRHEHFADVPRA